MNLEVQLPALVTLLAVALVFYMSARVSLARIRRGIDAPAMFGHSDLDRAFRIHQNTVENMVIFLPLLWLASILYSGVIAPGIGVIWLFGRVIYMFGYTVDPANRRVGALIGILCNVALFGLACWGLAA